MALAADRVDGLFTGLVILVGPAEFRVFPEEKLLNVLFIHATGSSAARITYRTWGINFGRIADTALRLARFFGNSPEFWLNLQAHYDLEQKKREMEKELKKIRPYAPQSAQP